MIKMFFYSTDWTQRCPGRLEAIQTDGNGEKKGKRNGKNATGKEVGLHLQVACEFGDRSFPHLVFSTPVFSPPVRLD